MLFDYLQSTTDRGDTPNVASFGSGVTNGNLIIVDIVLETSGATVSTVEDNKGNTYVKAESQTPAGISAIETWYALNVVGGVDLEITITASSGVVVASIHEYEGNGTVDIDVSGKTPDSNTLELITTSDGDLLHGFAEDNTPQPTAGNGFTRREAFVFNVYQSTEDKIASVLGANTVNFGDGRQMIGVAFKSVAQSESGFNITLI